jgi:hypothetical protein
MTAAWINRRRRWVVVIQWDDEGFYFSPPIGPFTSEGDMHRFESLARKRLRANGRKWQGRVKGGTLVHPEDALRWDGLHEQREEVTDG